MYNKNLNMKSEGITGQILWGNVLLDARICGDQI